VDAVRATLGTLGIPCERAASTGDALRHAQGQHPLIVVTGSLATAAEAREALGLVRD
jgi:folylpolyglutamate synthase/dihydropteroate synthase